MEDEGVLEVDFEPVTGQTPGEHEGAKPTTIDGVVIGVLMKLDEDGTAWVTYAGGPDDGLVARRMHGLTAEMVGEDVALLFEGGDPQKPLVLGPVVALGQPPEEPVPADEQPQATVDDEDRLVLSAKREIVLKCGKASITLTRAGKVILRGAYLLSRSSGVNRIKGGSVQIN